MEAAKVDGQDVREVYTVASKLIERARQGEGPAFLLCNTYRYRGHHVGDISRDYYRSRQEEQQWMVERDPIRRLTDSLLEQRIADRPELDRIQEELTAQMDASVQAAVAAPFPSADQAEQDVYAES
jgi:pyruvate dehydrogenase E1 component alpha subunit